MSMEIDIFAETDYGKIALRKIAPTDPNFRLYEAGWLGKHGKSDVMEVKGAVFRVAKTGPYKGKLGVKVQGTEEMAYVTADEIARFGKPQRDACKMCLGAKGGVPGNENVIGDVVVCDYCSAQLMDMKAAGWFGKSASVTLLKIAALNPANPDHHAGAVQMAQEFFKGGPDES